MRTLREPRVPAVMCRLCCACCGAFGLAGLRLPWGAVGARSAAGCTLRGHVARLSVYGGTFTKAPQTFQVMARSPGSGDDLSPGALAGHVTHDCRVVGLEVGEQGIKVLCACSTCVCR